MTFPNKSETTLVRDCKCEQWLIQFQRAVVRTQKKKKACRISLIHFLVHVLGAWDIALIGTEKSKAILKQEKGCVDGLCKQLYDVYTYA